MCSSDLLDYRAPLRAGRGAARGRELVRDVVTPLTTDRVLSDDIVRLAAAIAAGHFSGAAGSET